MRLIDADLLEEILDVNIQKLQDEIDDARTYIQKGVYEAQLFSTMEMIRVIREQPTAFDVDKVARQIEDLKEVNFKRGVKENEPALLYASSCLHKALDIVKAGRLDET